MSNMHSSGRMENAPAESYAGQPVQSEARLDQPGLDQNLDPSELMSQENADTKSLIYSLGNQGLYEGQMCHAGEGQAATAEKAEAEASRPAVDAEYFSHQMLDIQKRRLERELSEHSRERPHGESPAPTKAAATAQLPPSTYPASTANPQKHNIQVALHPNTRSLGNKFISTT
jgi:hypothetical protein